MDTVSVIPSNRKITQGLLLTPLAINVFFLLLGKFGIIMLAFSLVFNYLPLLIVFFPIRALLIGRPIGYLKSLLVCEAVAAFSCIFWIAIGSMVIKSGFWPKKDFFDIMPWFVALFLGAAFVASFIFNYIVHTQSSDTQVDKKTEPA